MVGSPTSPQRLDTSSWARHSATRSCPNTSVHVCLYIHIWNVYNYIYIIMWIITWYISIYYTYKKYITWTIYTQLSVHILKCKSVSHRIHGAGIYANIKRVCWRDPWHTIYSSTMDPMGINTLKYGLSERFSPRRFSPFRGRRPSPASSSPIGSLDRWTATVIDQSRLVLPL